tara:strand:- start:32803 stop:34470 length:1668 start_codon:yes stop_codon:yes gene_type:complete
MCGIIAIVDIKNDSDTNTKRSHYLELSKKIRHRGPDWNGSYYDLENRIFIGHERLSIVSPETGSQPLMSDDESIILSVNGEIYNYKELYKYILHGKYNLNTKSDCEVIIPLYKEYGEQCVKMLDGIFSFVLYDKINQKIVVARDPIGIIPLYYGITKNKELMFASEMKCLIEDCYSIGIFPPGRNINISTKIKDSFDTESSNNIFELNKYYNPLWREIGYNTDTNLNNIAQTLRKILTESVEKRLMTDVPFGVLLSGGLDSSLIASITQRIVKSRKNNVWGNNIHTFSIGLKDSPDLLAAKKVADFLGTNHHEFIFTEQEGIDAIKDLIWHLETYDITTIRASTPMYLMSRRIKALGIKMVLSGEGADEIFGGYLYFHNAPTDEEFHNECVKRVNNLHHFDCLRANKSTMAWGLEVRVPFLDQAFLEYSIPLHPNLKLKNKKEKYILRYAFDDNENPYLPEDILYRQKEQFSDGVGYSWIDKLKEYIDTINTDNYSLEREPNETNESYYYRNIFYELFPNKSVPIIRWEPKTEWEGVGSDPSGRAQSVHNESNNN